jgi:hypothetical protein
MKNLVLFAIFFFITANLFGQAELDSIYTKEGTIITGKVIEIGPSEVRYTQPQKNLDVVFVMYRSGIDRIVFSGGQVQEFETGTQYMETIAGNSEELFHIQRKNALKIDFLSIAANTITLTYERSLRPGRSVEFSGGLIGMGMGLEEEDASGFLFRGGYKFAKDPDFYLKEMRYSHILKGSYIKFEIDFATYSVTGAKSYFGKEERYNITKYAFLVVLGKQWVFSDRIVVDSYSGIGLGKNSLDDDFDLAYPYGFTALGDNFPMAVSFGLRLGFLL